MGHGDEFGTLEVGELGDVLVVDGDVMGDISSRRGTVQTTEARGHSAVVIATVPMSEMLEYATILTSITGGKGEFHMRFSHYDQMGGKLAEKVIAESRAGKD